MANPFLYLDDAALEDTMEVNNSSNPFFTDVGNENPFIESGKNPFAIGGDENTLTDYDDQIIQYDESVKSTPYQFEIDKENYFDNVDQYKVNDKEENLMSKKAPPPRPTPPNQNMQELISTLTDQMDMTSAKLLGQIPVTRTPSPVSMRDLHSPSPTPDLQIDDLLGVSDIAESMEKSNIESNTNFADSKIDLLGDTEVSIGATKSNEAILSLFTTPSKVPERRQPDFLCDENLEIQENPTASATAKEESDHVSDSLLQIETEDQNIEVDTKYSLTVNQYDLNVSPSMDPYISSADISEVIPLSQSNLSVNDDNSLHETSSLGSANPFMDVTEMETAIETVGTDSNLNNNDMIIEPDTDDKIYSKTIEDSSYSKTSIIEPDQFDLFAVKFEESKSKRNSLTNTEEIFCQQNKSQDNAWGEEGLNYIMNEDNYGFDADDNFSTMKFNPPREIDSDEENALNVVIKPKAGVEMWTGNVTPLAPPPKTEYSIASKIETGFPSINPFEVSITKREDIPAVHRSDSQETPPTPLFDEDVSQPLEDFPRINYAGNGWEMQLRSPKQKKITGQRFWKKIWVRISYQNETPVVQLFNSSTDKDPFQEVPLQPSYSVSEIGAQQYDQYGKIFTIKVQYVFYKERPGVRPGQVTKAERITNKLSRFAAYAIQGDYEGVKEFGSDLKKLGMPVEHAPQVSQLLKLGSMNYEDMKQFSMVIEEALFKMPLGRDRVMTYKMEEVQVTAVDEIYAEQDADGHVSRQIARVRLFFLSFLTGMPTIELGVNDVWRQGKEVVGRHDIIPVATEEWIRLENVEFHSCVQLDEYETTRTIRFKPPDACYIELMRFRVRPPKNRELPLQLKAQWVIMGKKVELRADVLVPGYASRSLGQIPCEDVAIRIPIPECWIYLFRVEKHFRYGSVKSAHRRTGKVKGIERILGAVETLQESLIEVTSGQAKYEHHHKALVWRCPRLPKEGQGAYTTHQLVCRLALTGYDQIPNDLAEHAYVEFTMPATQVSHMTVRSVSVQDSDADEPPEKYVRHLARHEYRVGIEKTSGDPLNPYLAATTVVKPATVQEEPELRTPSAAPSDSDSDTN